MPRLPLLSMFALASTSARIIAPAMARPQALTSSFRALSMGSSTSLLQRTTRPALIPFPRSQQVRSVTYGMEYQPSQRKRKRKHGFLARTRGDRNAFKMLIRRRAKGRRFLSH